MDPLILDALVGAASGLAGVVFTALLGQRNERQRAKEANKSYKLAEAERQVTDSAAYMEQQRLQNESNMAQAAALRKEQEEYYNKVALRLRDAEQKIAALTGHVEELSNSNLALRQENMTQAAKMGGQEERLAAQATTISKQAERIAVLEIGYKRMESDRKVLMAVMANSNIALPPEVELPLPTIPALQ